MNADRPRGSTLTVDELRKQIEKTFIARFWFSNMAWFNEMKRFFKIEMRYVGDDIVNQALANLTYKITAITEFSELINAENFDLDDVVQNEILPFVKEEIWFEYNDLYNVLLREVDMEVEGFFSKATENKIMEELQMIKYACI